MKIVGQPLGQNRVAKSGPPVQVTEGEPGTLFVHVGAAVVTVVTAVNTDDAVRVSGTATVVLRTQAVAEIAVLLVGHARLHLLHCTVSL